jgi:hypothetical protein
MPRSVLVLAANVKCRLTLQCDKREEERGIIWCARDKRAYVRSDINTQSGHTLVWCRCSSCVRPLFHLSPKTPPIRAQRVGPLVPLSDPSMLTTKEMTSRHTVGLLPAETGSSRVFHRFTLSNSVSRLSHYWNRLPVTRRRKAGAPLAAYSTIP